MVSPTTAHDAPAPASGSADGLGSRRELYLLLAFLTVVYIAVVRIAIRRFVWSDELFTFDIARSVSLHQLWERAVRFDNNPPAGYLLSRLSMAVFGATPFGLRLPSLVEFYLGCVAIVLYVRRWTGTGLAGLAVILLWSGFDIYYATEARAYALVFMCFAWLLLSWDSATRSGHRRLAIGGVALSAAGLLCAHVLALFSFLPFLVAEGVRSWRHRKVDYALWAALVLPLAVTLQYLPVVLRHTVMIYPPDPVSTGAEVLSFFTDTFRYAGPGVFLAALVIMVFPEAKKNVGERRIRAEDWALLALILLSPILLRSLILIRPMQIYNRYSLATDVTLCAAFAILLGRRLKPSRLAGWVAMVAVLLTALAAHRGSHLLAQNHSLPLRWDTFRTDIPLVDADGLTFYEMNHHESPKLLSRLYYLMDPVASLKYEKTNFFQGFESPDEMQKAGFPLPAHVEAYSLFVLQHPQFLVDGTMRDWLLSLLRDSGATIELIGDGGSFNPYPRDLHLYLVTMPKIQSRQLISASPGKYVASVIPLSGETWYISIDGQYRGGPSF